MPAMTSPPLAPAASPIIAVDGPAASGKGTLARRLAAAAGFAYLDTGSLYRAVGLMVLHAGADPADADAAVAAAANLSERLEALMADETLRGDRAAAAASAVAAIPGVRAALLDLQRRFAADPPRGAAGAVLDGRDIGTVICPGADAKLFVTASVEIRAERRWKELRQRGIAAIVTDVLEEMRTRDARDSQRAVAPLRPAEDAYVLDTSALDVEQAFEQACTALRGCPRLLAFFR